MSRLQDRLRTARTAFARLPRPGIGVLAGALGIVVLCAILYVGWCAFTIPSGGGLSTEATPNALTLESSTGEVFATRGVFKGERLSIEQISPNLVQAVLAIEDRRFYSHPGVDLVGTLRAAFANLRAGGVREGGSTITQQLAKMTFLSPERTLRRKVQELLISFWLEHQLTKDEILARYLNTAYFGAGAYGIDAASRRYFGKRPNALSLSEAAMLAGLVRAPSSYAPHRNLEAARKRAEVVLGAMADAGFVTAEQANAAKATPAQLAVVPETPPGRNFFADWIDAEMRRLIGPAPLDLSVRTTLDVELQDLAEKALTERLAKEGGAKNAHQAALVAMSYDGAVLAMVGGRDYNESQFNRAVQARRQPGSLFKLFVYLAAFNAGYTPDSTMVDGPVSIGDWQPQNYGGKYRGTVTLRTAFAESINTVAVQLAEAVGRPSVIAMAKSLGIDSELAPNPSLALGAAEVTLLEMTRAFAAVAAGAPKVEPHAISGIRARDRPLYTRPAATPSAAPPPYDRRNMVDLMLTAVRQGTGKAAQLDRPVAGKTGTTQEYRDAWFIGFTADVVVGVWVGNDDNAPMKNVTGGDLPAKIWHDFVAAADKVKAARPPEAAPAPTQPAPPPPSPTAPQVAATEPPPPAAVPQPSAGESVRGIPAVLDTGTLRIGSRTVRLLGVDGERGRLAQELALYIGDREVACRPVGTAAWRCRVDAYDLSEVVVFNGGGKASGDAPPDLRAAEEKARMARRGIWRSY